MSFDSSTGQRLRLVPFLAGILAGVVLTSGVGFAAIKGSAVFRDVPTGHYADDAIGEMYALGVVTGFDAMHFKPDEPVTRGQLALMLQRLRNEIKGITPVASTSSSRRSPSSSSSSTSSSSSSFSSVTYGPTTHPAGIFRFATASFNVDENVATGQITIAIVRTGGADGSVTVQYSMSGGTAVPNTDYTPTSGTLAFSNHETSKTLAIPIKDNTAATGNKTFEVRLSNPTNNAILGVPNVATVIIVDNETTTASASSLASSTSSSSNPAGTFTFSALAYGAGESEPAVTVTVNRQGGSTGVAGVSYGTSNDTAVAGVDYNEASGTLSFAAGETSRTFTVSMKNNTSIDGDRRFRLILSNPTGGAALGSASNVPFTVIDDEILTLGTGSLKFNAASYTVLEGESATISVSHVGGTRAVSVNYATANGSAISPSDYDSLSGTLNFAAGELTKSFTFAAKRDTLSEGDETVNLSLASPTNGATLIDPQTASIKIQD